MDQEVVLNQILNQLEEITTRIENLELQNNTRTRDRASSLFARATRVLNNTTSSNSEVEPIVAGDRIRITNHYRGQHGKEGTVTRVTEKRIFFVLDGDTNETFRIKKNVRRIAASPTTAH